MTRHDAETRAKMLSQRGWRIKLWETKGGWQWEWHLGGVITIPGSTSAAIKPTAFLLALYTCPI